jgi:hypothetical protein
LTRSSETNVVVGIVDSGLHPHITHFAASAFRADGSKIITGPATQDLLQHGAVTLDIVHAWAPGASLAVAQVFFDRLSVAPRPVAAALDWLIERGAKIVNLSLTTQSDSQALRESCQRAVEAGCLLVAAVPARGPQVFPAAYPGVLRVTGDARCAANQFSWIRNGRIDMGASPLYRTISATASALRGGSSIATARVTGALAALLARGVAADTALQDLVARCTFRGTPIGPI